jgi:hypothetical protein
VSITTSTGKIVEGKTSPLMMTPFWAMAMGLDPHNLEAEKSQTIRRMVTSINFLERSKLEHDSLEPLPDTIVMAARNIVF